MSKRRDNLVWIDLEMTGLDPDREAIIEIATIVTDKDLGIVAEGPVLAVHQPQALLDNMDEWNTKQHASSGLTERVRASTVSEARAERETLEFLHDYADPGLSPMCGNSVGQDRRFLVRYMPELAAFFHYRNLDVSSVKILAQLWAPQIAAACQKTSSHRALDDIRDSINELQYYRDKLFKLPE